MAPIIHFQCRHCETQLTALTTVTGPFPCPKCSKDIPLMLTAAVRGGNSVDRCAVCGHDNLYIQKDFNREFGLLIVCAGIAVSLFLFSRSNPSGAMLALAVTAALDAALYYLVGDVTVCYVCHAIYRGFPRNPGHQPFELKDLEKYGGRNPRF